MSQAAATLPFAARRMSAPKLAKIIAVVAEAYDYEPAELRADHPGGKQHAISHVRFIVIWLARELTNLTYPQISHRLGFVDHTSALYGKQQVDAWIAADPTLRDRLDVLARRCVTHAEGATS